jgi:hypothetical protein
MSEAEKHDAKVARLYAAAIKAGNAISRLVNAMAALDDEALDRCERHAKPLTYAPDIWLWCRGVSRVFREEQS